MRSVLSLLAVATVAIVAVHGAAETPPSSAADDFGPAFTISNTISSSATSQIPTVLDPGVTVYLWYVVKNRTDEAITIKSLSISTIAAPPGCTANNLDVRQSTFSGLLVVPPRGTNAVSVPISLIDSATNQDSCEDVDFKLSFTGSSTYGDAAPAPLARSGSATAYAVTLNRRNVLRGKNAPSFSISAPPTEVRGV